MAEVLRDFAPHTETTHRDVHRDVHIETSSNQEHFLDEDVSQDVPKDVSVFSGTDDVDKTALRADALGIPFSSRDSFACVIPGDAHNHGATLCWYATQRAWRYSCEDEPGDHFGLAHVLAFQRYGQVRRVGWIEQSRWWELLDFRAGLIKPAPNPRAPTGPFAGRRSGRCVRPAACRLA
jgi:hypothetical protein